MHRIMSTSGLKIGLDFKRKMRTQLLEAFLLAVAFICNLPTE